MQVDLNLLVALDALIEHESVQGAAASMHLTPPAMSHALGRLRLATGDDLLVRNGRTMVPTPRALQLQGEVRELVTRATSVLSPPSSLDLATLERRFVLRGNDGLIGAVAPLLLVEVADSAPGVTLVFLGEQPLDGQELVRGTADLEIGGPGQHPPTIRSEVVGADHLEVVMRHNHPLAAREAIGMSDLADAAHVVVSRRGRLHGPIDEVLAAHGLHRRVIGSLPSTVIALDVVQNSDAIAVLASRLIPENAGITSRPLPFELGPLSAVLSWHSRHDSDPAHRWLRTAVSDLLADLLR